MQVAQLLTQLKNVKGHEGQWTALCPAHNDREHSLSIGLKDNKILLTCFAGCSVESICQSIKVEVSDLFLDKDTPKKGPTIVAMYDYKDEKGEPLYQKVRFEPKDFRQRRKVNGQWSWNLNGVRRVLYRLPELLESKCEVYLVEGEKDADNLRAIGKTATTAGGVQDWRDEFGSFLTDRKVVIIPDNDRPGYALAQVESKVLARKAKSVSVILIPEGYKDISDWLQAGNPFTELHEEDVSILNANIQFENKGSRYLFRWEGYQAEISKIKTARDTTICQLVVYSSVGAAFRTRLNLESDRARSSTAKELATRFKGQEWKDLLEEITNKTLQEFEKGEPVIELHSNDAAPALDYLIYPLVPAGKPTVLFGDPGSGKSQLAVVLNILAAFAGWDDNPLRLIPPKKSMRGLVLDWEADEDDWRRQLAWFTQAFDLGYATLFYRRCSLSLGHDLDAIKAHIEMVRADYVIIDSVSLAAGGDLNHMDVATNFFRATRQLTYPDGRPLTSISLAHTSKDRDSKQKTILGSVLFEAGARNVWEVRAQEDEPEDILDIALFHRKSNLSKKHPPLGYRIQYRLDPNNQNQTIPQSMSWLDPKSVEEFVERMKTTDRILHYLKGVRADEKTIAEELGLTVNNTRVSLFRLKTKNLVVKGDDDRWAKLYIADEL